MKILLVDDEPNILSALTRQLHSKYELYTASCGEEGLQVFQQKGPFAVVVSDFMMPGMDGIEFLKNVTKLNPDTVKMILTGNRDQESAMDAINEGNAYRFLVKPCFGDVLQKAVDDGIELYRLRVGEKEILEKTLSGSIAILTEMLSIVSPKSFGRTHFIKNIVNQLITELSLDHEWEYNVAAMLCLIGYISIPASIIDRMYDGDELTEEEQSIIRKQNRVGAKLIRKIPRMESVALMIKSHTEPPNKVLFTKDIHKLDMDVRGGMILRLAIDFDLLSNQGLNNRAVYAELRNRKGHYHPQLIQALSRTNLVTGDPQSIVVSLDGLKPDMILMEDIYTSNDKLVITAGQAISAVTIKRLYSVKSIHGLREPLTVRKSG